MNTRLLRRIQKQMLKEPKQFYMDQFFTQWIPKMKIPNCGTAACIGGWAIALHKQMMPSKVEISLPHIEARSILMLTNMQADLLFYKECWPGKFRGGRTPAERARRAVARIDHFVKTKGRE